jgi:hypothetical protein
VPGDRLAGVDYIRHLDKPSQRDVRWVRMNYPYAGNSHTASNVGDGQIENHDAVEKEQGERLGFDPYVEHGKKIGQDPEFLRKMDRRQKEHVAARAEEAAAAAAKKTRVTIVDA